MHNIAIVTGNFKGLGKNISEQLESWGYQKPDLTRSADYNLCNPEDSKKLIEDTIKKYGQIDLLINNVGNYVTGYIDELSIESWQEMQDSNLNSAFYLCKYALPYLRQSKGKIINIGYCSLNKASPEPEYFAYHIAKSGLLLLTKTLAKAEAKHGITVNMISPGSMENTIEDHSVLSRIPIGRFASLDEVSRSIKFIVDNDYITGQNLEIAGGRGL
jgi:NAD(P)-dependent dehydrogenase (short-subunit alcohol dehydrogenase family)